MRIGIDARLVHYQQAGIGQYIFRLTEALEQIDHEDTFVLFQSRRDSSFPVDAPNFVRRSLWTPSHHRFETRTLSLEFLFHRLDLLHSPDFIPPGYTRFPSVITVHDLAFLLYPRFLTPQSARYYGQIDGATRRARHIIAVSHSTKRDIVRLLGVPGDKVTVIYEAANPIFKPLDRPAAVRHVKQMYGIDRDIVLFVSTLEPRKNLPSLLEAFRLLVHVRRLPVTLVVAGKQGWLTEPMNELVAKLNLGDRVRFIGAPSNDELVYLYNAARVYALPSFYEGFGLTPLEAMACGTPVVVSRTSSLPEVVGDAGLLIDPHDAEALSVALWRVLIDDDLHAELCEKGLRRSAMFSWERAARETLEVYKAARR